MQRSTQPEINPRYAAYCRIHNITKDRVRNIDYMAWISMQANACRKEMGLPRYAPIPRDVFEAYLGAEPSDGFTSPGHPRPRQQGGPGVPAIQMSASAIRAVREAIDSAQWAQVR